MTQKLYHTNQYQRSFSSVVLESVKIDGKPGVILEQSAFYPTSGGQPHDTGTLNGVRVIDVIEQEGQIIHMLERPIHANGVEGEIDWPRRFDHMQQHSGQHLLSQAFISVCQAETISFHLGEESATIDVKTAVPDSEIISAVERLANGIIYENRRIIAHIVEKDDVARFPLRKPPTVDEHIRILEIENFDYSACGGTHCSHSGEIGSIKITKVENYKGGARIHFLCGGRALRDYQQKTEILSRLCECLSSAETEVPQHVRKLQDDAKSLRREVNNLNKTLLEYEAAALLTEREVHGETYLLCKTFSGRNPKDVKLLASRVIEQSHKTVLLFGVSFEGKATLIFQRSADLSCHMGAFMKQACAVINGRGGGQPQQAQGGGPDVEKLDAALQSAREMLLAENDG